MVMFLFIVLLLLSAFLIMIVLLQRGRGAGLAGAFGAGGGSQSAFGTKTGDVFTWVTVIAFVLFMLLSILLFYKVKWSSIPDDIPAAVDKGLPELVSDTTLKIIWSDKTTNLRGYHITRSLDAAGTDAKQFDAPANQTEKKADSVVHYFVDTNLTPGTTYYYTVRGFNSAGESIQPVKLMGTTSGRAPLPALETLPMTMPATVPATTMSIETPSTAPATTPLTTPARPPAGMGPLPTVGPPAPATTSGPATSRP